MTTPAAPTGLWVWMEQEAGRTLPVGLELVGRARELGDALGEPVTALFTGKTPREAGAQAVRHGADEARIVNHPMLDTYTTDAHTKALAALVAKHHPKILLLGATPNGRDLAGRLAVRLRTGLTANATRLDVDAAKGLLISGVPGFGGSVVALIKNDKAHPQMSTVRPGVFAAHKPDAARMGRIVRERVDLQPGDERVVVLEHRALGQADVASADRVVVAGLGTGGDLAALQGLADALGAAWAVTRPLVDLGIASRDRQVGSTGIALRSKVAVIAGASGASHFTSGLKDVGLLVAINQDPAAEIFDHADLCIVGDLFDVAPLIEAELRKLLEVPA